jgi:hypothetical protein
MLLLQPPVNHLPRACGHPRLDSFSLMRAPLDVCVFRIFKILYKKEKQTKEISRDTENIQNSPSVL